MSVTGEDRVDSMAVGADSEPGVFLAAWRWLGPDLSVLLVMLFGLISLVWVYGATVTILRNTGIVAGAYLLGNTALALLLRKLWRPNGFRLWTEGIRACRDWVPFTLLIVVYENLRSYTGLIRPESIDTPLAMFDQWLWGVQPTVWAQQFANPILTDVLIVSYASLFPLPLALLLGLYVSDRRDCFRELATAVILCILCGFILYLTFPAGPPRFYLTDYEPARLPSFTGLYDWTDRTLDYANQMIVHSSFPSLHAALSFIALRYAFRRDFWPVAWRWLGPLYVVLTLTLWISTIYLRHHWTPDLAAGLVLGFICAFVARAITQSSNRTPCRVDEACTRDDTPVVSR